MNMAEKTEMNRPVNRTIRRRNICGDYAINPEQSEPAE